MGRQDKSAKLYDRKGHALRRTGVGEGGNAGLLPLVLAVYSPPSDVGDDVMRRRGGRGRLSRSGSSLREPDRTDGRKGGIERTGCTEN